MGRLLAALFGAFGIVKYSKKWDKNATWEKFIDSCWKAKRPGEHLVSFMLVCDISPEFMSGGISGATKSGWQHAFTCLWDGGDYVKHNEIVESLATVVTAKLSKYDRDDLQVVAFSVSLNDENFNQLKSNLYSQLGKPYDVAEFLGYMRGIFSAIPNPKDLFVCSTNVTYCAQGVKHRWFGRYKELRLLKKNIKNVTPDSNVPADIWAGCYPQFSYRYSRFHCK